jgi:hypothetical protein
MNRFLALGAAAAVVVLGVFIGLQLFGGNVGGPGPTVQSSPTVTPPPSPLPSSAALPLSGEVAIGSYRLTQNSVRFTLDVSTSGWTSEGGGSIAKGSFLSPSGAFLTASPVA